MNQGKNEPVIQGIKCDVSSCSFNDHEHRCTAQEIKVCSCPVRDEKDAACETYQPNCNCQ